MKNKSELKKTFLILFDNSGYTRFMQMHRNQVVHAEETVVELLSSIISSTKAPMTCMKSVVTLSVSTSIRTRILEVRTRYGTRLI